MRVRIPGLLIAMVVLAGLAACQNNDASPEPTSQAEPIRYMDPPDLNDPAWMSMRKIRQLNTVDQFRVFKDFRFVDRYPSSGITFSHGIVDDAGLRYKMVHYDHGNGVAVADVDGDGLLDLYFTTQVGDNQLWRNRGDGTFEDITERAGVALNQPVSVAPSFADIDNDGDPDLFVTTVRFGNYLFENDGTGRFTDISEAAGLNHKGHSSGSVFFDYDRDGLLDLLLTNVGVYTTDHLAPVEGRTRLDDQTGDYEYYVGVKGDSAFLGHHFPDRYERNILYQNQGGNRFVDVSDRVGLVDSSWSGDATVFDANADGWPDLYILSMQGNDVFFENQGGERFLKKTGDYFPQTPWGAMGVKVLDYNNDGLFDLYVTDMHSDMWETNQFFDDAREKTRPLDIPDENHLRTEPGSNIFGNALFRNEGDGTFTDVALETNAENYWPWGISSGDLNADGYEDLFVATSMNYPFRYQTNTVLLNDLGERFLDSAFILGIEPRRDDRTAKLWFEYDCATEQSEWCLQNNLTQQFDMWGALGSRSSVIFDLDNDGDLDIVTNDFNSEPLVLISDLSEEKPDLRYLKVKLVGTASNRDALGAVVRVHTAAGRYAQTYDGKSGYLAQSSYPLYFGLGDADAIERIEVRWPSGNTQTLEGPIETNQQLEIVEE